MRLAGKSAVITGAGSGIGRASALLFAREGAAVTVADVDEVGARETVARIEAAGGRAQFVRVDVTRAGDVEAMVRDAAAFGGNGRLDVAFNNAGISCVGAIDETSEEEWDRVMAVNIRGVYLGCRFAVLQMKAQGGGGCIINMSSSIALTGLARRAAYAASKGAVLALTKSMQVDAAPHGIRVNALMPGTIFTPFVEGYLKRSFAGREEEALAAIRRRQLTGELGRPEDVAHAALYLASDESSFVLGAGLVIDGGLTAGKS
jgi:NAD(P)-dependent dehydrogenase (short-subunit alcohol dehydrogenase family)